MQSAENVHPRSLNSPPRHAMDLRPKQSPHARNVREAMIKDISVLEDTHTDVKQSAAPAKVAPVTSQRSPCSPLQAHQVINRNLAPASILPKPLPKVAPINLDCNDENENDETFPGRDDAGSDEVATPVDAVHVPAGVNAAPRDDSVGLDEVSLRVKSIIDSIDFNLQQNNVDSMAPGDQSSTPSTSSSSSSSSSSVSSKAMVPPPSVNRYLRAQLLPSERTSLVSPLREPNYTSHVEQRKGKNSLPHPVVQPSVIPLSCPLPFSTTNNEAVAGTSVSANVNMDSFVSTQRVSGNNELSLERFEVPSVESLVDVDAMLAAAVASETASDANHPTSTVPTAVGAGNVNANHTQAFHQTTTAHNYSTGPVSGMEASSGAVFASTPESTLQCKYNFLTASNNPVVVKYRQRHQRMLEQTKQASRLSEHPYYIAAAGATPPTLSVSLQSRELDIKLRVLRRREGQLQETAKELELWKKRAANIDTSLKCREEKLAQQVEQWTQKVAVADQRETLMDMREKDLKGSEDRWTRTMMQRECELAEKQQQFEEECHSQQQAWTKKVQAIKETLMQQESEHAEQMRAREAALAARQADVDRQLAATNRTFDEEMQEAQKRYQERYAQLIEREKHVDATLQRQKEEVERALERERSALQQRLEVCTADMEAAYEKMKTKLQTNVEEATARNKMRSAQLDERERALEMDAKEQKRKLDLQGQQGDERVALREQELEHQFEQLRKELKEKARLEAAMNERELHQKHAQLKRRSEEVERILAERLAEITKDMEDAKTTAELSVRIQEQHVHETQAKQVAAMQAQVDEFNANVAIMKQREEDVEQRQRVLDVKEASMAKAKAAWEAELSAGQAELKAKYNALHAEREEWAKKLDSIKQSSTDERCVHKERMAEEQRLHEQAMEMKRKAFADECVVERKKLEAERANIAVVVAEARKKALADVEALKKRLKDEEYQCDEARKANEMVSVQLQRMETELQERETRVQSKEDEVCQCVKQLQQAIAVQGQDDLLRQQEVEAERAELEEREAALDRREKELKATQKKVEQYLQQAVSSRTRSRSSTPTPTPDVSCTSPSSATSSSFGTSNSVTSISSSTSNSKHHSMFG